VILALDVATHDHLPALLEATPAERNIAAEIEAAASGAAGLRSPQVPL
jgi:hypothetical protein